MNMRKAKNIIICYWFKELENNPLDKIDELEKSLNNEFLRPFYTKDMPLGMNISLPRIEGIDKDKISYFNISLINSCFTYQVNDDMDLDDIILYINSKAQLYFDVLKEVFNVDILYTSLKVEFVEENYDISSLVKLLKLKDDNYEDELVNKK